MIIRWNLRCFEWQVSQLIIRVTKRLTQRMFGFWFFIMNYLSTDKKKRKKVASSLPPAPKQTSQNLNYFKTYASEFPFLHSVPVPSQSPCRDLHSPFSYRTQKLSVQFFLKTTIHCRSIIHSSVTILSTLVLCIHSLYLLAVAAAHILPYTPA